MDAFSLLRSIRRMFGRRAHGAAPVRSTVQPVGLQPAIAVQASPAEPPEAPLRKMRTLEEVRADLARLRLSASERHARSHAWRDTNFAPTDFVELANN